MTNKFYKESLGDDLFDLGEINNGRWSWNNNPSQNINFKNGDQDDRVWIDVELYEDYALIVHSQGMYYCEEYTFTLSDPKVFNNIRKMVKELMDEG